MGIFDRFSSLLKSNINDLITSAENPEKMLNQIIVDMRSQLVQAKQQVAVACFIRVNPHDPEQPDPLYTAVFKDDVVLLGFTGQDMLR